MESKRYRQKTVKTFIAILGVSTVILFQNCSGQEFSFNKVEGTLCQDATAPALKPKLKFQFLPSSFNEFMATPTVADLNGDGVPSIVTTAYSRNNADHFTDVKASSPYQKNGVLWVLDGKTGNVQFSISSQELSPTAQVSALLIDLDNDGKVEIIYPHYRGDVIALNHNGSFRWRFTPPSHEGSNFWQCTEGFNAHDIDGDGKAEIFAGPYILKENSSKNGATVLLNLYQKGETGPFCNSYARSLNPSKPNEMQIIAQTKVFDKNGNILFSMPKGFHSTADITTAHPGLEIVTTGNGKLYIQNGINGSYIAQKELVEHGAFSCDKGVGGGPSTLGDFNGDGQIDIAIATGGSLSIYDNFGNRIAGSVTQDCSSLSTAISSFDFNGDGKQEILYGDEQYFRIYHMTSSSDLEVLHAIQNPSWTLREHPIVVDVDGNGSAEIVVTSTLYEGVATQGIRVFEASSQEAWMKTLPFWNQYSYYVSHVTANLRATSKTPTADAQSKTFRRNTQNSFFEPRCIPSESQTSG